MTVASRIFGIKIQGKKTDCFCPFADMLNHRRPRQTQWFYSDEHQAFIIQALENIEQGEEVYDSYGRKCNSRFLLNYGFIVEKNENNEFPYIIELTKDVFNYEAKYSLIDTKSTTKIFRISPNMDDSPVKDYFSFLRFLFFEGSESEIIEVSKLLFSS